MQQKKGETSDEKKLDIEDEAAHEKKLKTRCALAEHGRAMNC